MGVTGFYIMVHFKNKQGKVIQRMESGPEIDLAVKGFGIYIYIQYITYNMCPM